MEHRHMAGPCSTFCLMAHKVEYIAYGMGILAHGTEHMYREPVPWNKKLAHGMEHRHMAGPCSVAHSGIAYGMGMDQWILE